VVLDTGHHQSGVPLADLRNDHTDREAPLLPERPREMIGPVIEFLGGGADQLLGAVWYRFCSRGTIDHERDGGLRKPEMLRKRLQAYA